MDAAQLETECRALVVELLDVKPELVTRDTRFIEDLNADSLDIVELQMAAEDKFHLPMLDDEWPACETFGQALELIEKKLT